MHKINLMRNKSRTMQASTLKANIWTELISELVTTINFYFRLVEIFSNDRYPAYFEPFFIYNTYFWYLQKIIKYFWRAKHVHMIYFHAKSFLVDKYYWSKFFDLKPKIDKKFFERKQINKKINKWIENFQIYFSSIIR